MCRAQARTRDKADQRAEWHKRQEAQAQSRSVTLTDGTTLSQMAAKLRITPDDLESRFNVLGETLASRQDTCAPTLALPPCLFLCC